MTVSKQKDLYQPVIESLKCFEQLLLLSFSLHKKCRIKSRVSCSHFAPRCAILATRPTTKCVSFSHSINLVECWKKTHSELDRKVAAF